MKNIYKTIFSSLITLQLISLPTVSFATDTNDCSSGGVAKVCQTKRTSKPKDRSENVGKEDHGPISNNHEAQNSSTAPETHTSKRREGFYVTYNKDNPNNFYCTTLDGRVGHVGYTNMTVDENGIPVDHGGGRHSPSSAGCIPNDTRTLTSADSPGPTGPTYEEVMTEIRHAAESLEPGKPTLHQSYVIEYGNGDTDTNYTAGKPVTTYPRERPRQTATSYAYQRSGNFHAYATVHYTARFRVDGGPWQMMMVTPQATSDPLLVRVWWVDVGRVAGDCSYDDTRWGCKNDPTMGKKDNPNPRLRKADIRTGQRWHLNDNGDGDTEYSLHRDWPDM